MSMPFARVEAVMKMLYLLGEFIKDDVGSMFLSQNRTLFESHLLNIVLI
jgi:hypothetical protein